MADGLIVVVLAVTAALYARGARHLEVASRPPPRAARRTSLAFAAAVACALLAASQPLDAAAHRSLVWHMVQHVILLGVVPPLLAVSAPLAVIAAALPSRTGRSAQRWVRRLVRAQSRHWGGWLASSFLLATATLAAWHLPGPYGAAVRSDPLHALEHVSFVATATLFWWMALGAGRPARRGAGVLAVFVSSLPATALGVLMVLASTSWYAVYGTGAHAVRDQQVAGAVMWGFGSLALVAGGAALFAGWLAAMDRAERDAARPRVTEPW